MIYEITALIGLLVLSLGINLVYGIGFSLITAGGILLILSLIGADNNQGGH